jgi:hypothetical protein
MLKFLIAGIWGALMTGAGVFVGQSLSQSSANADAGKSKGTEIVQVTTDVTGAPIITDGKVQGYLVFRIKSSVDVSKLPAPKFEVNPFLIDAAFHASYEMYPGGFKSIGPDDLDTLTKQVAARANEKLGAGTVSDVVVDQFNYIPADRVRQNIFTPK